MVMCGMDIRVPRFVSGLEGTGGAEGTSRAVVSPRANGKGMRRVHSLQGQRGRMCENGRQGSTRMCTDFGGGMRESSRRRPAV